METTAQSIAKTYDDVPYDSRPFPQSHPARSAAIAKLFGLSPPVLGSGRVLELGCAAGGNLIPIAAAFPEAQFLGVDLSAVQIGQGRERIAELGLSNIELRHQSISDLREGEGQFDYIICHGVYSWVPSSVRDAIMRVCRENLSEHGIAYISYNVFPGWRLRGALRDAMLFHVEGQTDPRRRVTMAREMLAQLSEATDAATPYGQMLRKEVACFRDQHDYYLVHEYLEINNEPCYVADFIAKARAAKLEFLTEANFNFTIAETFGPKNGQLLRELSGNRLDRMEQYIDFLSGRTFRQTLLVRCENAPSIQRNLDASRLDGLHINASFNPTPEKVDDLYVFKDAAGRTLSTPDPFVRDAVQRLAAMFPQTATLQELLKKSAGPVPASPQDEANVRDAVFKMAIAGICDLATEPVLAAAAPSVNPKALEIARVDARSGRGWTTNMRHESIPLTLVQQAVLPVLDGEHDEEGVRRQLEDAVRDGKIVFLKGGEPVREPAEIDASIAEHLKSALETLARSGLLVA